jgi:hypothetical protein
MKGCAPAIVRRIKHTATTKAVPQCRHSPKIRVEDLPLCTQNLCGHLIYSPDFRALYIAICSR